MFNRKGADFPGVSAVFPQDELFRDTKIIAGSTWQYPLQLLRSACLEWFGLLYSRGNWRKMGGKLPYSQFDDTQLISLIVRLSIMQVWNPVQQ